MAPSYAGAGRELAAYQVSTLEQISSMGAFVTRLATASALLFLWAPNALVLDGTPQAVARRWGFEPKQLIPWLKTDAAGKPRLGGGHYTRVCTEQLLLCARGRACGLVKSRAIPGIILAPRGAHSAKPDESYQLIEALAPAPYFELYARRRYSDRWDVWGDECQT